MRPWIKTNVEERGPSRNLADLRGSALGRFGREISPAEWAAWWELPLDFGQAQDGCAAIARVLEDRQVTRPWADYWSPVQPLPTAYVHARDEALRHAERRPPTPIYLWEGVGSFAIGKAIGPWGAVRGSRPRIR
jgi:hypothetical protein